MSVMCQMTLVVFLGLHRVVYKSVDIYAPMSISCLIIWAWKCQNVNIMTPTLLLHENIYSSYSSLLTLTHFCLSTNSMLVAKQNMYKRIEGNTMFWIILDTCVVPVTSVVVTKI